MSSCSVEIGLLQLILVHILVSSAKCNAKFFKFEGKSLIWSIKNKGPRTEPWNTTSTIAPG